MTHFNNKVSLKNSYRYEAKEFPNNEWRVLVRPFIGSPFLYDSKIYDEASCEKKCEGLNNAN